MPLASHHAIAFSLIVHAGLLGLAARSPGQPLRSALATRRPAVETISVEAAEALGHTEAGPATESSPAAAAGSATPASSSAAPEPRRARARRVRTTPIADAMPSPEVAPSPPHTSSSTVSSPSSARPAQPSAPAQASATARAAASVASIADAAARASADGATGEASGGTQSGRPADGLDGSTAPAGARAELLARYVARVRARVEQHREYPYLARRANLEGTVCLRVSIAASGSLLAVAPTCGSASEPLLSAALESVSSAAPFPPLPAALGARLTLEVPVVFQLDSP